MGADKQLTEAARLLGERNAIARQCADALDNLQSLKTEFADYQKRVAREMASIRLAAGHSVDEVSDQVYKDQEEVIQRLKDRLWNEGYLEGIRSARAHLESYVISETHGITAEK